MFVECDQQENSHHYYVLSISIACSVVGGYQYASQYSDYTLLHVSVINVINKYVL